jgi:ADP-ribosylglycohydrolase
MAALEAPARADGKAANDSKGCGGVMRAAPAGLLTAIDPFVAGCELAQVTHGHPSGYLSAGAMALIVSRLLAGRDLEAAVWHAASRVMAAEGGSEVADALKTAVRLSDRMAPERIAELGQGWTGEEELAIAVYSAAAVLRRPVPETLLDPIVLAANHDGDSDSTAAIAGQLLGAVLGLESVPGELVVGLDLRGVVTRVADDLVRHYVEPPPAARVPADWAWTAGWPPPHDDDRYPPW